MRWFSLTLLLSGCAAKVDEDPGTNDGPLVCQAPGYSEPRAAEPGWERTTFEDWPVVRFLPASPRALVFYFHGTGGNADDVAYLEVARELDTLVDLGFAVVSSSSTDRTPGEAQWDVVTDRWADNADLVRLGAIRDDLIASGAISADTPVFTDGFSNGGAMSAFFAEQALAQGWPVRAAAMHSSGPSIDEDVVLPRIFLVAENDLEGLGDRAAEIADALTAAGQDARYHAAVEGPLDADRLLRIPGYTEQTAARAVDDAFALGLVDADGVRLVDVAQVDGAVAQFEAGSDVPQDWEVSAQLRVVWSTHRFDSQFAQDVCELFVEQL